MNRDTFTFSVEESVRQCFQQDQRVFQLGVQLFCLSHVMRIVIVIVIVSGVLEVC